MVNLLLVIGLLLAPFAAAMAFLITYEEWSHHGLPRRIVLGRALITALASGLFFLAVAALIGFILNAEMPAGLRR